jgi:anti-sigma factor RsiW
MLLACKKCQSNLVAYLHHELTPIQRRQVARHLDECERCYAMYLQEQDLAQNLRQLIPLVGQERKLVLDRVWTAIQTTASQPQGTARRFPAHYGLAAVVFTLMLLIPLTLGNKNLPLKVPPQPAPLVAQATPSGTNRAASALQISLTPEARTSRTAGPSPDAISTP